MNEQKQRQILAEKFFEATAKTHPTIKSMLASVNVDGFEQHGKEGYIFHINASPGKEAELEALKSLGNDYTEHGHFTINAPFDISTWTAFVWLDASLIFRDGLLWGFQLRGNKNHDVKKAFDRALKCIRKRRRVEWYKATWLEAPKNAPEQKLSQQRKAFLKGFYKRVEASGGKLPLLTLSEFFDGNTEEESIAPNQWGFDRPKLQEILERLLEVEGRQDVAWVRVQLHADTLTEGSGGEAICEIAGNAIAICTTANIKDIEKAADTESLCSDGIIKGWASPLGMFCDVPIIPEGHRVVSLVWD